MNPITPLIFCLAYVVGLLVTKIPYGGFAVAGLGVAGAIGLPRVWRSGATARTWLLAGCIGLVATFYFQLRIPQPAATDISRLVTDAPQEWVVTGRFRNCRR